MKSKFAKFIDGSVGAALIFFAATAVMRYTTTDLAVFSALSVTACACLLLSLKDKRAESAQKLSRKTRDMFYDFMFLSPKDPPKRLFAALEKVSEVPPVKHGDGVYLGKTAAYCFFDTPSASTIARTLSKAKHFGAKKTLLLCASPPEVPKSTGGMKVQQVVGDDVYKLFASLGALPPRTFASPERSRFSWISGALGKDKIFKFSALSASMFFISILTGRSIVMFVCAVLCAVLAVLSVVVTARDTIKNAKKDK